MDKKTCLHCGVKFLPAYRVTKAYWAKRQFCSPACREAARSAKPKFKVTVTCPKCGAERRLYPSLAAELTTKFCRDCYVNRDGPDIEVTCPECGKKRMVRPARARAMRHGYCDKCRATYTRHYDLTIPDTWSAGYVFGAMIGDGTLIYGYDEGRDRRPQGFRLAVTCRAFAERFLENATACTGKTTPIHEGTVWNKGCPKIGMPPMLSIRRTVAITDREWHEKIAQVKKDKRFDLIMSLGLDFKKGFVQGLLDAEGYIFLGKNKDGHGMYTDFANKDMDLLRVTQAFLAEAGVKSAIYGPYPYSRGVAHLRVRGAMVKTGVNDGDTDPIAVAFSSDLFANQS